MTQHHRETIEALLVEQTLALARTLVLTAEPVKAVRLLEEVAPQAAIDSAECADFAKRLRSQVDQAFSDTAYLKRYTEYDNGGVPNQPFSDTNVLNLYRARAMLQATRRVAATKPNFRYLSIGGGDGSIPRAVLQEHPQAQVWFSELLGVGGAVVDALQREFPGRVHVDGRYDTLAPTAEDFFDVVECLEVAEHVTRLDTFLSNISRSLVKDGIACISVPNHLDWVEPLMLSNFDDEDNWYHHVRAFTPKFMAGAMLQSGLLPTIFHDGTRGLFAVAGPATPVYTTFEEVAPSLPGEPGTRLVIPHKASLSDTSFLPGYGATITVWEGVLIDNGSVA